MKDYLKPGEYSRFAKKSFRCVADRHSPMKRCILCDLQPYGLCDFVRCQPDEREDHQSVVFRLTRTYRNEKQNNSKTIKNDEL